MLRGEQGFLCSGLEKAACGKQTEIKTRGCTFQEGGARQADSQATDPSRSPKCTSPRKGGPCTDPLSPGYGVVRCPRMQFRNHRVQMMGSKEGALYVNTTALGTCAGATVPRWGPPPVPHPRRLSGTLPHRPGGQPHSRPDEGRLSIRVCTEQGGDGHFT